MFAVPPQHGDYWEVDAASGARVTAVPPATQYTSKHAGGVLIAHVKTGKEYTSGLPDAVDADGGSLNLGISFNGTAGPSPACVVFFSNGTINGTGGAGGPGFEAAVGGPNNTFTGGGGGGAGNPEGAGGDSPTPGNDGSPGSRPSGGAGGAGLSALDDSPGFYLDGSEDGGVALRLFFNQAVIPSVNHVGPTRLKILNNGDIWGGGGGGGGGSSVGDLNGAAGGDSGDPGTANGVGDNGDGGEAIITFASVTTEIAGGVSPRRRGDVLP